MRRALSTNRELSLVTALDLQANQKKKRTVGITAHKNLYNLLQVTKTQYVILEEQWWDNYIYCFFFSNGPVCIASSKIAQI